MTEISRMVYDAIMMVGMPGIGAFPGFGNAGKKVFRSLPVHPQKKGH